MRRHPDLVAVIAVSTYLLIGMPNPDLARHRDEVRTVLREQREVVREIGFEARAAVRSFLLSLKP